MNLRGYHWALVALLVIGPWAGADADVLAYYSFDTNGLPTSTAAGVWASELTGHGLPFWDINNPTNPQALWFNDGVDGGFSTGRYFRVELRATSPGKALDLASITCSQQALGGGRMAVYAAHTSVDEFWATAVTDTNKETSVVLDLTVISNAQVIVLHILTSKSGLGATVLIPDLTINGTIGEPVLQPERIGSYVFLRSSVDGFAGNLFSSGHLTDDTMTTFRVGARLDTRPGYQNLTEPVEFRIYSYETGPV